MRFQVKRLAVLATMAAIPIGCYARTQHINMGSVVIFRYSKNVFVIAADSHRVDKTGPHDDECKIFALNGHLLFGSTGVASVEGAGPLPQFNAIEDARSVAKALERAGVKTDLAREASGQWARKMKVYFDSWPQQTLQWVIHAMGNEPGLACGVFASGDPSGDVSVFVSRIVAEEARPPSSTPTIRAVIDQAPISIAIETGACGIADIASEFLAGLSQRAIVEQNRWQVWRNTFGEDAESKIAIRLVELTIQFDRTRLVGGPVDAAKLERNGEVHWIQHKPNCPEN